MNSSPLPVEKKNKKNKKNVGQSPAATVLCAEPIKCSTCNKKLNRGTLKKQTDFLEHEVKCAQNALKKLETNDCQDCQATYKGKPCEKAFSLNNGGFKVIFKAVNEANNQTFKFCKRTHFVATGNKQCENTTMLQQKWEEWRLVEGNLIKGNNWECACKESNSRTKCNAMNQKIMQQVCNHFYEPSFLLRTVKKKIPAKKRETLLTKARAKNTKRKIK